MESERDRFARVAKEKDRCQPLELLEQVATLRLSAKVDHRLQELMDRSTEGLLGANERADLKSYVDWSEQLPMVRAKVLKLLGRSPA